MKPELPSVGRRGFLKRAAAASAALAAPTAEAAPQPAVQRAAVPATPVMSAAAEAANPPDVEVLTADRAAASICDHAIIPAHVHQFLSSPRACA